MRKKGHSRNRSKLKLLAAAHRIAQKHRKKMTEVERGGVVVTTTSYGSGGLMVKVYSRDPGHLIAWLKEKGIPKERIIESSGLPHVVLTGRKARKALGLQEKGSKKN